MFLPCFLLERCSQWLLDYDLNAPSAGGECIVSIIRSNAIREMRRGVGSGAFLLHLARQPDKPEEENGILNPDADEAKNKIFYG